MLILAGDVGGTKANLGLFRPDRIALPPLVEKTYSSPEYSGPEEIVTDFLREVGDLPVRLSLGLPGPIEGDLCRTPNLPWLIDRRSLETLPGVDRAIILNDLVATAHGLAWLGPDDLVELNPEAVESKGNKALLAAGTGLGGALLFYDGETWKPSPAEIGHTDFAPKNNLEAEFLGFRQRELEHVSYDEVLSGSGLTAMYRFFLKSSPEPGQTRSQEILTAPDPAAEIGRAGLEKSCPICVRALEMFVDIYGSQAGNLALIGMARGGVYIGGGIGPKIRPALEDGRFLQAFRHKDKMSGLLSRFPLRLILEPKTALLGAARAAT